MRLILILIFALNISHIFAQNIIWDKSNLRKIAPIDENATANYARIIELHDKKLVCIYETDGAIKCLFSKNKLANWTGETVVSSRESGLNMTVPEIIQLKDHSLLASYNARPYPINGKADTTKHFEIRTKKSYDGGKTWQNEQVVYRASNIFENGCWEPSQLQLPNGKILLFFSNENIYRTSSEQNISMLHSLDNGLTWSKKPEIVSFTPNRRDGMPVPILLNDKKTILFSIEDNATGNFKPTIVAYNLRQTEQNMLAANIAKYQPLKTKLPDSVYAGAPYLKQMNGGTTVLSFQSTLNRTADWQRATMQVAIGDENGKNFILADSPFEIPQNKHALWSSLCVLKDNTIIAVTSTNAYGNNSIWMVSGKLVK